MIKLPKQKEDELRDLARQCGPLRQWAFRQLVKHGLIPDPDAPPTSPVEPVPPPEAPRSPAEVSKVQKVGKYGNCHDCGCPFDALHKRTPFHESPSRDAIIYVCRTDADRRFREKL